MAEERKDRFGRVWRLKAELLQEDVERWNRVFVELRPVGLAEQRGAHLKAAIVAGWIESPAVGAEQRVDLETGDKSVVYRFDGLEVGKMKASEVAYYGRLCEQAFQAATILPDKDTKN